MNDGIIIDIRSNYKYNIEHIPNSINIDSIELVSNPNKYLNKNQKYYIYCQTGHTSKIVVDKLNSLGYNTVNIDGGYNLYKVKHWF